MNPGSLSSAITSSAGVVTGSVPAIALFGSETLTWILAGIVAYWLAIIALRQRNWLPSYVGAQGPILTIHTKRGRTFLDWLSGPKRFWRAWANIGVGISIVVMASMFVFLVLAAYAAMLAPEPTAAQQPRNVLVIPGVNDFLPLSAAPEIVFGLLVGLVVHEGGHGLLCRVEDIDIESMGVAMFAIIPIGAFVEPDQQSQYEASRGEQTRMFAAGVTNNFVITIIAFALLFGPIAGAIAVAPGAAIGGVAPGSPAADATIEANDRITAIEGIPIEDNDDYESVLADLDGDTIEVELNGDQTVTVERTLLVTATVDDGPVDLNVGDRIVAVDGEPVWTERDFEAATAGVEQVTLTIEPRDGGGQVERQMAIGAATTITEDDPLANAGGPAGESFVITSFDGERITDFEDLDAALDGAEPGDTVIVGGYHGDEYAEYTVELGTHPQDDGSYLGITHSPGISGISVSELGVQLYPAEEYLIALGGGDGEGVFGSLSDSFLGKIVIALFLPIVSFVGYLPFNFAGFTGGVQNFYEVQGSLAVLGDGTVFLLANLLFWTAWINVQLGFFNCIPAFPLDGGHILRTSTEAIFSRLPFEATRGMVRTITTTIGLTMLLSFLLLLFGQGLLAG